MAQTIEEFRAALAAFAERIQRAREHVKNEEATKVSLILPFIGLLGYDILDPTEVAAEHASDFSEKYKNRADYAILRDLKPVIAVECKCLGNGKKDDRGQLKAYFNASKTVKLGILTDGILYEFFIDSQEPNMMDDDPFLTINFGDLQKTPISDTALEGLFALTKAKFDPETVSENARRSITHRAFYDYLGAQFLSPSIEFTRFLLKEVDIKHVRSAAVDGYREIAKAAFTDVFTSHVLKRLDIAGTTALPMRSESPPEPTPSVAVQPSDKPSVVTTEAELRAFEVVRRRLAFLSAGKAEMFEAIGHVSFRDFQGKMAVFYLQERKGRLLDILEGRDGSIRFVLADDGDATPVADLATVDERLKGIFQKKVAEILP